MLKPAVWDVRPAFTGGDRLWAYDPIVIPYWEGGGNPKSLDYRQITGTRNGTAGWATTNSGVAISQDGSNSGYLDFGNPTDLQFSNTTSFTFFSVFVSVSDAVFREVLRKDTTGTPRSLWLWRKTDTDNLQLQFGNSGETLGSITSNVTLTAGKVQTACVVRDVVADQLRLFIDGVKDNQVTDGSTGTWTVTAGNVQTRSGRDANSAWSGEKILDVIFPFNALSDDEAADLTNDPFRMIRGIDIIPTWIFASLTGFTGHGLLLSNQRNRLVI